jgi:hypothetical protein
MTTSTAPTPAAAGPTLAGKLVALAGVAISCAYLANLGAGLIGEVPDVIPGLGNLDEVFFSGVLIMSLHKLGIPVIPGLSSVRPNLPAGSNPPSGSHGP